MVNKRYINIWRDEYKKLKPIYSKTLGQIVYFNSEGFNHLLFSKGHKRPNKEILSRLPLLKYASAVISKGQLYQDHLTRDGYIMGKVALVEYVALIAKVGIRSSIAIKVVLRKKGINGNWYFFSIMRKRKITN